MPNRPLRRGVIAGGGIAGLLAARILSSHFERVTLVERDTLPRMPEARRGVPQGRHAHLLLIRGRSVLEELFPGLEGELRSRGAVLVDAGRDFGWHHAGGWRTRYESDLSLLLMSRPLLETAIAERVRALPNVMVRDGTRAEGLGRDSENAISGLRVRSPGERTQELQADLVVDAMGRGSPTPQWLSALGFAVPSCELLPARVTYASCTFRRPVQERRALFTTGAPAKRSGGVLPIEGERWMATVISFFEEPSPKDHGTFLDFVRSLDVPEIYEVVRANEPLSPVVHYRFPGSQRRHYERLKDFPQGLIVLGDGVCSFNPIYGQGMTVSAIEAECLDRELTRARGQGVIGPAFGPRWFRIIKPVVDAAWDGVALEDLRFPELARQRPGHVRALQWYMDRVHRATHRSPVVTNQFYRVANFLDPPTSLFRAQVMAEVFFGGWWANRPGDRTTRPSS